jgi:hypothetical protein
MKALSSFSAILIATSTWAQCPFTPTIEPGEVVLCPGENVELNTQEYDSYQWYADGVAIDGATTQTLTMEPYAEVTVEATLDGCTEMSAPVIVDGWVFLLPFVAHAGDEPLFIDFEGTSNQCDGDTVLLIFSYDENIEWFQNGQIIPGANDDTLIVTTTGNYTASGAPGLCPNFIQPLGLEIPFVFNPVIQPEVVLVDGQLCASPEGEAYQWYRNGEPFGSNTACIEATTAGSYTVDVTYEVDCSVTSAPYVSTGLDEAARLGVPQLYPVPAKDAVTVRWPAPRAGEPWELVDAVGRRVREGSQSGSAVEVIDLSGVQQGRYWLRAQGQLPLLMHVVK